MRQTSGRSPSRDLRAALPALTCGRDGGVDEATEAFSRGECGGVKDLDYTRPKRQGLTTNPLMWQGNIDYRNIALHYATLGRTFRTVFLYNMFYCVFINTTIVKTISS